MITIPTDDPKRLVDGGDPVAYNIKEGAIRVHTDLARLRSGGGITLGAGDRGTLEGEWFDELYAISETATPARAQFAVGVSAAYDTRRATETAAERAARLGTTVGRPSATATVSANSTAAFGGYTNNGNDVEFVVSNSVIVTNGNGDERIALETEIVDTDSGDVKEADFRQYPHLVVNRTRRLEPAWRVRNTVHNPTSSDVDIKFAATTRGE